MPPRPVWVRYHPGVRFLAFVLLMTACLLSSDVRGQGKPIAEATPADEAAARDAYIAAKSHYDAGRLEPALAGFEKSYDIVASPNSHLMVARVLDELGRHVEAFEEMRATMREAEAASRLGPELAAKYKKTLDTSTALTAELRQKVGFVIIELEGAAALPDGATISVRGKPIRDIAMSLIVEPGPVEVVLETPQGRREVTANVAPGGEARVRLEVPTAAPAPAPEPRRAGDESTVSVPEALAFTAAGLGAAGFIVFGVFGGLTVAAFDDLEESCPSRMCPLDEQDDIDEAKRFQVVANVGLGVGVVGAIASVALFLLNLDAESRAVGLLPARDGVAFGGTF